MSIVRPPANHSHAAVTVRLLQHPLEVYIQTVTSSGCYNNTVDGYLVDVRLSGENIGGLSQPGGTVQPMCSDSERLTFLKETAHSQEQLELGATNTHQTMSYQVCKKAAFSFQLRETVGCFLWFAKALPYAYSV